MSGKNKKPAKRVPKSIHELSQTIPRADGGAFEPSFLPDRLTDAQFAAIGAIAWNWSILEFILESLLSRLALAPGFPALALTNNLAIDNRLNAFKSLLDLHQQRYRAQVIDSPLIEALRALVTRIATLKGQRNYMVHRIWMRFGDKIAPHRFTASLPDEYDPDAKHYYTTDELIAVAAQIKQLADEMFIALQMIPAVDEGQQLKSLSPAPRHRQSGTE